MTVSQLEREMGSVEFREWMALADLEPFGSENTWLQTAVIAQATSQPHYKKAIPLDDFLPACFKSQPEVADDMQQTFLKNLLSAGVPIRDERKQA